MKDFEMIGDKITDSGAGKLAAYSSRLVLVTALLAVAACGSSAKKVVTKDDSADYQSAVSLPPLKKPTRVVRESTDPYPAGNQESNSGVVVEQIAVAGAPNTQGQVQSVSSASQVSSTNTVKQVISVQIISPSKRISRLQIDADFDRAWGYLADRMQQSGVTVFSRNQAAGRISIGCAEVENALPVTGRGGWSFLRKKKPEKLEYCALQAIGKNKRTVVSVLDRAGQEVSSEHAAQVFKRILNN